MDGPSKSQVSSLVGNLKPGNMKPNPPKTEVPLGFLPNWWEITRLCFFFLLSLECWWIYNPSLYSGGWGGVFGGVSHSAAAVVSISWITGFLAVAGVCAGGHGVVCA